MEIEDEIMEQSSTAKENNKGLIKLSLHRLKTATRSEVAADTKILQTVVSSLMDELLQDNEILEKGFTQSSAGKKAAMYSLNNDKANIVSLIAEPNQIEYIVTDLDGQIFDRRSVDINKTIRYFDNIVLLLQDIFETNKKVGTIGIGVPGAVTPQGKVFAVPQILELEECNLKIQLEEIFQIPVTVKNDINVTALGYYRKGVAFTLEEMVYIHIGGGLGAGVIIGGNILSGFTNFAGEIAYMQVGERKSVEEIILNPRKRKNRDVMISKMIINIICLLNPSIIVIGGELADERLPEKIENICRKFVPSDMLPLIRTIEDERKYYFEGLSEVAMDTYCIPSEI